MIDGISDHEVSYVLAPSEHPIERSIYLWSRAKLRHDMQSSCDEFIATYSASIPVDVLWNNFLVTCNAMIPTKTGNWKQWKRKPEMETENGNGQNLMR